MPWLGSVLEVTARVLFRSARCVVIGCARLALSGGISGRPCRLLVERVVDPRLVAPPSLVSRGHVISAVVLWTPVWIYRRSLGLGYGSPSMPPHPLGDGDVGSAWFHASHFRSLGFAVTLCVAPCWAES